MFFFYSLSGLCSVALFSCFLFISFRHGGLFKFCDQNKDGFSFYSRIFSSVVRQSVWRTLKCGATKAATQIAGWVWKWMMSCGCLLAILGDKLLLYMDTL